MMLTSERTLKRDVWRVSPFLRLQLFAGKVRAPTNLFIQHLRPYHSPKRRLPTLSPLSQFYAHCTLPHLAQIDTYFVQNTGILLNMYGVALAFRDQRKQYHGF